MFKGSLKIEELAELYEDVAANMEGDRPIFCWHHIKETHHPYRPDFQSYVEYTKQGRLNYFYDLLIDEISWYKYKNREKDLDHYYEYLKCFHINIDLIKQLYDAQLKFMDKNLGEFISRIKDMYEPLNREYVLIITADHGEEFMEHGGVAHSINSYTEVVGRIPLIIYESWNENHIKKKGDC